jgi:hypothetical protein
MGVSRLVLRVEQLVLSGFDPRQRDAVVTAIRGELARQLAAPDLAGDIGLRGDTTTVHVGPLTLPRTLQPDQVGAWIARAIARGLTP